MTLDKINNVLCNWGIIGSEILQRYDAVGGGRLVIKVATDSGIIILKGQPVKHSEENMLDIGRAHEFLGNKNNMSPKIYYCRDGSLIWKDDEFYYFVMEFISGRNPEDTTEDWSLVGSFMAKLHNLSGYNKTVAFDVNEDIRSFKELYKHKPWKAEFDERVDSLPNFDEHTQCLIHADIWLSNCIIRDDGSFAFIDLDGVGVGSQYICLGLPLVNFTSYDNGVLEYRHDLANAFLEGYNKERALTRSDYELMWKGAVFSYIYNMQWFDDDEAEIRWQKLKFALKY